MAEREDEMRVPQEDLGSWDSSKVRVDSKGKILLQEFGHVKRVK